MIFRVVIYVLSPLLLTLAFSHSSAAPEDQTVVIRVHPNPGTSKAETAKANATAHLMTVYFGFAQATQKLRPQPAWMRKDAPIDFDILPVTPDRLCKPEFAPIRSAVEPHGEFYVARVFAKGDPKKKPAYLYLLKINGDRTEIARAFQAGKG